MIARFTHWLWMRRGCRHEWQNTGAHYTDTRHGYTVTLKQCSRCNQTLVVYA